MECPYCHKEMKEGRIPSMREQLRWCPLGEDGKVAEPYEYDNAMNVALGRAPIFNVSAYLTPSWYCADCRVVITPVPEIEGRLDELKRKWNGFAEKQREKHAAAAAEREEKQREKQREKRSEARRKKDPWEVD